MAKILVVDDLPNMRKSLELLLRGAGHEVDMASDGEEATALVSKENYDLVLTDLRVGEHDGIEILSAVRANHPATPVIVMTAYGSVENAVLAMKMGAFDYIEKPFSEHELLSHVSLAVGTPGDPPDAEGASIPEIVGDSPAIRQVVARILRIARTDAIVLITGESGSGKEVVARAIHAHSRRAEQPFVAVNCAAITETLLESELFGHAKGAFTGATHARRGMFEEAENGTLFLDEIGETPMAFQAKLLRAIQEGEVRRVGESKSVKVNVRIIAATNQDLPLAIRERRFREDLFYRLNVARFILPPLRERGADIPTLANYFLAKHNLKLGTTVRFAQGTLEALKTYPFPGNIRELEHMIEQAVVVEQDGSLTMSDLLPQDHAAKGHGAVRSLSLAVDEAERVAIEEALRATGGNRERAATLLEISPTTLWRKMTKLGIVFTSMGPES